MNISEHSAYLLKYDGKDVIDIALESYAILSK